MLELAYTSKLLEDLGLNSSALALENCLGDASREESTVFYKLKMAVVIIRNSLL